VGTQKEGRIPPPALEATVKSKSWECETRLPIATRRITERTISTLEGKDQDKGDLATQFKHHSFAGNGICRGGDSEGLARGGCGKKG